MKTVRISASRSYDILIGRGLLKRLGELAADCVGPRTAALISDDRVFALYGAEAESSLTRAGFRVVPFVFPQGEQSKTLATYGQALNALCRSRLSRSDVVVALGGGVVGDLAGFVAATYQRGIDFIQVPTTLLAMVDSSVGGKTAVDLEEGKNQVGAFCQPRLVVCDPDVLDTLPEEQYRCGCAEIIKYGLLGSAEFFDQLMETPVKDQVEQVIETCVRMKGDFVMHDEFDRGSRQLLNLGHSVGHAVEARSGFSILHGQAVAIGMAVITRAAAAKGYCSRETLEKVLEILRRYGLPTETHYPLADLVEAAAADKKRSGGSMSLIVPEAVGACRVLRIPAEEMGRWMAAGGIL